MKTNPALLLIGVSPGANIVQIWHSQQMQDISLQGLLELIKRGTIGDHDPPPCGSPDIRKIDSNMDIEAAD